MREIVLANNRGVALVDDEDYELISKYRWYLHPQGYAGHKNGKTQYLMHRLIMGNPSKDVDHINGNKLDNRRNNLRVATPRENAGNSRLSKNNTSGYKGVRWSKGAWQADLKRRGMKPEALYLGRYKTKEEAAEAYNKAALEHFGEFAKLNVIIKEEK